MRFGGRARAMVVVAVLAVVAVACVAPPTPRSHDTGSKDPLPVLVIGGFEFLCVQYASDWDIWRAAIEADRPGTAVESFVYDPCQDIRIAAEALGRRVEALLDRTGAPEVQVVAHSQANLVTRWCIRFGTCAGKVDTLLGLAAANHGTIWANLCALVPWFVDGCSAMTPEGPILRTLNGGDETWGDTRYVTASSWCDAAIVPSVWGALDGAENVTLARCVGHSEWKTDPAAIAWGVEILAGRPVSPLV